MSSIDVIVPCYMYGHFLRECIESILTQSHKDVRVVIIDDASPDNTYEVATELARANSRVSVLRHDVNKGPIATFNEGLDWASADYVLLISADDFLLPGALERAAVFLDSDPEVGFVFGNAIVLTEDGSEAQLIPIPKVSNERDCLVLTGPEFIELGNCRNIVPAPTSVVRTALQKQVGGYRAELPHAGDLEMWWRLAAHSSVGVLGARQAVYRLHGSNMSSSYRRLADLEQRKKALYCFLEVCSPIIDNPEEIRRGKLRLLGREAVRCASGVFNEGDMELVTQLEDFALEAFPEVNRSWPWIVLRFKTLLGQKGWRAIRPIMNTLRKSALGRKG